MLLAAGPVLAAGLASAQQTSEGIVQLGHGADADCLSGDCCDGSGACAHGNGRGRGAGNGWFGGGRHGRHGECRHYAAARCNGGRCGFGGNPHYGHCCLGCWLNAHSPYHRCTYPPDHGWAPPAHRPILASPALYGRMFAAEQGAAVVQPGYRHPMVYMPTDTTQLGFYYQQVPYWQPRPGMIPPVPQPDEWHTPYTGVVFTGYEDAASFYGSQNCPDGPLINQGVVEHPVAPADLPPSDMIESAPVPLHESIPQYSPEPLNPQMVPPAGPDGQALPPLPPSGPSASTGQDLGKSAAVPRLIPVPPQ
jgi:hypothetical protein